MEKEEMLLKMLASCRYLAFARKNNVSDSVILTVARDLGFLAEQFDAIEAKETKLEKQ